jgi:Uri superfamily endonuclease
MLHLERKPGTYCLHFASDNEDRVVQVGALGKNVLRRGYYAYVGSAMHPLTGVLGRVAYHAGPPKFRWNVDWVKPFLGLVEVWFSYEPGHPECRWADAVGAARGAEVPLPQFGARDCKKCPAHFFHFSSRPSLGAFCRRLVRRVPGHGPVGRLVASTSESFKERIESILLAYGH